MPSAPSRVKKRGFCHDDSAGSMVRIMVNLGAACAAYVAMTLHTPYCSSEAATFSSLHFSQLEGPHRSSARGGTRTDVEAALRDMSASTGSGRGHPVDLLGSPTSQPTGSTGRKR